MLLSLEHAYKNIPAQLTCASEKEQYLSFQQIVPIVGCICVYENGFSTHKACIGVFDCIQHSLAVKEESWMNRCWDSASEGGSMVHVTIEGSALPFTCTASASQNVTKDVLHKKPEEWL